MVGSRVSASRTITSSSEGPLYLSYSQRVPMISVMRSSIASLFIVNKIIYVLSYHLMQINNNNVQRSFPHHLIYPMQDFHQLLSNYRHLLFGHLFDLDVSNHRRQTIPFVLRMFILTGGCIFNLAHLKISALQIDPPNVLLNLHLYGSVFNMF